MEEKEVKILDINKEEIIAKLESLGAQKIADYNYRRRVFDFPDLPLNKDYSWLRVRDEGDKVTCAYKKRLGATSNTGDDEGMLEYEITVDDFDTACNIFLSLGMIEKHYIENKRSRYLLDTVECDIDEWPQLNPFLELEADSWEKINKVTELLGYSEADHKKFTAQSLYKNIGINPDDCQKITFDGVIKKQR